MFYAVKDNRQYPIDETEKQKFIDLGYKIAKLEKGKLIFEKEADELKLEEVVKENTSLKGQLTKAQNQIKELEEEISKLSKERK